MIWAILAALGVPIWLIVGALAGALISRRHFREQPDVFALSTREHGKDGWPRRRVYGRYVHDVLLVNSGLALVRTRVWVVERLDPLSLDGPVGKFADPQAWTATLEGGEQHDLALAAVDAHRLSTSRRLGD